MRTLLIILFISISSILQAQTAFKVGYSLSWFSNSKDQLIQARPSAGIVFNINLSKKLFINPEINYSLRGSGYKRTYLSQFDSVGNSIPGKTIDYYYNLNYLEFPILLTYKTKHIYFSGGVAPSFLIWAKLKHKSAHRQFDYDPLDNTTGFDLPIIASIGYNFTVSKTKLFLEARQSIGIIDVFKDSHKTNRSFNLSIGGYF